MKSCTVHCHAKVALLVWPFVRTDQVCDVGCRPYAVPTRKPPSTRAVFTGAPRPGGRGAAGPHGVRPGGGGGKPVGGGRRPGQQRRPWVGVDGGMPSWGG